MTRVWTRNPMTFAAGARDELDPSWRITDGPPRTVEIPAGVECEIVPIEGDIKDRYSPAEMCRWFQIRHMEATQSAHLEKYGRSRKPGIYSDGEKVLWWTVRLAGRVRYIWERDLVREEDYAEWVRSRSPDALPED